MRPKKSKLKPTESEIQLLEKLRRNPEMRKRIEPILKLAEDSDNTLNANQIEELLVDEIGKLGNQTVVPENPLLAVSSSISTRMESF